MSDEELNNNEDFIITLSIEGTSYEDVEIKVNYPHQTIRYQIDSIISVFELPKMDNGANFIRYELKQIIGEETKDLDLEDEDGRELTLLDHNIRPGDKLSLVTVPCSGSGPIITVIFYKDYRGSELLYTESETFKVYLRDWQILVGDFIKGIVSKYSLPLFYNHYHIEYSLGLNYDKEPIICKVNSTMNDYLQMLINDDSDSCIIKTGNLDVYLHATISNHRNMTGSLLERWNNYKRRIINSKYLLIQ